MSVLYLWIAQEDFSHSVDVSIVSRWPESNRLRLLTSGSAYSDR